MSKSECNHARRSMLKKSITLAAGVGATAATGTTLATPCANKGDQAFDHVYDVIVVGSGFAGMSAAVQAAEEGQSVLVVDKMPVFGGNSTINGGAMAIAGSATQKEKGISDSVELMVQDMLESGRGMNDVEMLKLVCQDTASSAIWLEGFGVEWKPFVQHFGGHSVPRILQAKQSSGAGIIRPLIKAAEAKGVEMKKQTKLESFITDDSGRVIGFNALVNHRYERPSSGEAKRFGARKGVIMATGGFGQDIAFRQIHQPKMTDELTSTNHPGANADALKQMMLLGANPVHLDQIQLGPWTSPDEKGFGTASQFNTIGTFPKGIVVDPRSGQRYFNELADRRERATKIMQNRDEKGQPVYPIGFTNAEGASRAQTLEWGLKYDVIKKAENLDDLASLYDMPAEALKQQVADWNKYVRQGKDEQFGRPLASAIELNLGPWYAVRMWPKVHYCMGGVRVNAKSEVLALLTDQHIEGLYAAGEATGGIHGASRLGGCAIAEGVVTGRNAARNIANKNSVTLKQA
ncbi:flavocytochrome c [Ferrimonas lipolytica]|uniref:Flavocytochrome c n=1 Tax=Ferrimonas lipolytica TaxID=2724191 RepID=A0A6H1UHB3_9GAMM|nr:flavocytochrome c [Ferrimonas lipolytica]QIZ77606.1 flavocytochrome c [Ferrimonas lipolytica]